MHNGVFVDLHTVALFHGIYHTKPETGEPLGAPQVVRTLAVAKLTHGPAPNDRSMDAVVAFRRMLTYA